MPNAGLGKAVKELIDLIVIEDGQCMMQADFEDLPLHSGLIALSANEWDKNFGHFRLISSPDEIFSFSKD